MDEQSSQSSRSQDEPQAGIAERVKFWEEQDRINQTLIPRVIRQHELLTAHIADHENLPLVAGNAISEALAQAREEQQQRFDTAIQAVEAHGEAQERRFQAVSEALAQAREEQQQRFDAAIQAVEARGEAQERRFQSELSALRQERSRYKIVSIAATAVAVAAAVVAIVVQFV